MEGIPGNGPFPSDVAKKFEIPKEAIPDLRWELDAIGITAATVFPDSDGLAKELKRNLAYEV